MIRAIVIGGSPSTWVEVELANQMCKFDMVVAVKRAGVDYDGRVDHWVSYHPEMFDDYVKERAEAGREPAGALWTTYGKIYKGPLEIKRLPSWGGSSGLGGVAVALHNGANKVIICGVPLDQKIGHYHDKSPWGTKAWAEASKYRTGWLNNMKDMQDKVKSMSGWTMKHLGYPTPEWLAQ